jgi:hypothetical protein
MVADSKFGLDSSTNFLLKSAYIENKFLHSQGCDTWYSGIQRLFKISNNNTGIHNMLKYKHNTFNRKKLHLPPNDNFFKVRMINVILNCFKKLAPGSIVKRTC